MRWLVATLLAGVMAGASGDGPARAQGEVYAPAPPRGSAYVRIVNTLPNDVQIRSDFLPTLRFGSQPALRATPYTVVENVAGRPLRLEMADGQSQGRGALTAAPGAFVTVIIHHDGRGSLTATPISEDTDFNRARARLAFYNALPDCPAASVQLQPSGQAVFADVPPLQGRARSVNPVVARVRAICGANVSAEFALEGLEAGGMYSMWIIPGAGAASPEAFLIRDTTAVYRR